MRSLQARKLLNRHCQHREEWRCGQATVRFMRKDQNPRFDRRVDIFLDQPPAQVDVKKIARLLRLLDRLGHNRDWLYQGGRAASRRIKR